ncbi:unnamed protein product [Rotaria socialis]|uniref:Phosphatidylinositol-glycan biosynthesis class W protein n=2 Tax=Rotaria socialis TaxID=392032 RepID=A0A820PAX6_9BILA|nr:unnamed protein product [Rotaria socialis]
MDLGVGLFAISHGMVSSKARNKQTNVKELFLENIILFILGFIRITIHGELKREFKQMGLQLFLEMVFLCVISLNSSRKLCNLSYVSSTAGLACVSLACFGIIQWLLLRHGYSTESILLKTMNQKGLDAFLIGNVLTGIINLNINTIDTSDIIALLIIFIYLFLVTLLQQLLLYNSMASNVMIVFCVDNTTSMALNVIKAREMVINTCKQVEKNSNIYIKIIKLESMKTQWLRVHCEFTNSMSKIVEQLLKCNKPDCIYPSKGIPIGDLLHDALNVDWPFNDDNQIINKKLVVLVTDGVPNGLFTPLDSIDPWVMSHEFHKKNIVLAVVGVGNGNFECDAFYHALAKNTGGLYIPFVNAERVLQGVIGKVIVRKDTFSEAFRLVPSEYIEIELYEYEAIIQCGNINQIKELFLEAITKADYDIIKMINDTKFRF